MANHRTLPYSKWTYEELEDEYEGLQQSIKIAGYSVKDMMMRDDVEDELNWRDENDYREDVTPKEIELSEKCKKGNMRACNELENYDWRTDPDMKGRMMGVV